jgi:hypothetical protein
MNVVTVQSRSTRVSAAFELRDAVTGGRPIGAVNVRLTGVEQTPIAHPAGFVLFMDLPEGSYTVRVEASHYVYYANLSVDTAQLNPLEEAVLILLEPKVDYEFPAGSTLLYGTLSDQNGGPLAGARVEVVGGPFDGTFANTDAAGRVVLYFAASHSSHNLSLSVTKESFQNKVINAVILRGQSASFDAFLVGVTGSNIAVISGTVSDPIGNAISQASVEASPWAMNTLSGPDGRFVFARSVASNESVELTVSQAGFAEKIIAIEAIKGGVADVAIILCYDLRRDTAILEVRVRNGSQAVPGALVEILEKGRSALSNADGRVLFYFEDPGPRGETVHIKVSKIGYYLKISRQRIRGGRTQRHTLRLKTISG